MNQRELRRKVEEWLLAKIESRKVYQRKPNTFVLLHIWDGDKLVEAFGFSKVMYPDNFDPKRGAELAQQKAIAALAKELIAEDAWDFGFGPSTSEDK